MIASEFRGCVGFWCNFLFVHWDTINSVKNTMFYSNIVKLLWRHLVLFDSLVFLQMLCVHSWGRWFHLKCCSHQGESTVLFPDRPAFLLPPVAMVPSTVTSLPCTCRRCGLHGYPTQRLYSTERWAAHTVSLQEIDPGLWWEAACRGSVCHESLRSLPSK